MYMPIWILYWFPLILPVNYIMKLLIICAALFLFSMVLKINGIFTVKLTLTTWIYSIIAEMTGIATFYLCETNVNPNCYSRHYILFCFLAFTVTFTISCLFHYFFCFRKANIQHKKLFAISILLTLFSSPYLFLLPQ